MIKKHAWVLAGLLASSSVSPLLADKIDALYTYIINSQRESMSDVIGDMTNPFNEEIIPETLKEEEQKPEEKKKEQFQLAYKLQALIGNKAKINDRWYQPGDIVSHHVLIDEKWYKIMGIDLFYKLDSVKNNQATLVSLDPETEMDRIKVLKLESKTNIKVSKSNEVE